MKDYKNVEGTGKLGWAFVKPRPSQIVAADVSRRSGRSRARCSPKDKSWTIDQVAMVNRNPPTHVGGYAATGAVNCDAPGQESSISNSLIFRKDLM